MNLSPWKRLLDRSVRLLHDQPQTLDRLRAWEELAKEMSRQYDKMRDRERRECEGYARYVYHIRVGNC